MRAALVVAVAMLMVTDVATPGGFLREAAFHLVTIGVLWIGVTHIIRFNVMGYFLLAAMTVLISGAVELLGQPNASFHANGYAVVAFAVVLLAWPVMLAWPLIYWRRNIASVETHDCPERTRWIGRGDFFSDGRENASPLRRRSYKIEPVFFGERPR